MHFHCDVSHAIFQLLCVHQGCTLALAVVADNQIKYAKTQTNFCFLK